MLETLPFKPSPSVERLESPSDPDPKTPILTTPKNNSKVLKQFNHTPVRVEAQPQIQMMNAAKLRQYNSPKPSILLFDNNERRRSVLLDSAEQLEAIEAMNGLRKSRSLSQSEKESNSRDMSFETIPAENEISDAFNHPLVNPGDAPLEQVAIKPPEEAKNAKKSITSQTAKIEHRDQPSRNESQILKFQSPFKDKRSKSKPLNSSKSKKSKKSLVLKKFDSSQLHSATKDPNSAKSHLRYTSLHKKQAITQISGFNLGQKVNTSAKIRISQKRNLRETSGNHGQKGAQKIKNTSNSKEVPSLNIKKAKKKLMKKKLGFIKTTHYQTARNKQNTLGGILGINSDPSGFLSSRSRGRKRGRQGRQKAEIIPSKMHLTSRERAKRDYSIKLSTKIGNKTPGGALNTNRSKFSTGAVGQSNATPGYKIKQLSKILGINKAIGAKNLSLVNQSKPMGLQLSILAGQSTSRENSLNFTFKDKSFNLKRNLSNGIINSLKEASSGLGKRRGVKKQLPAWRKVSTGEERTLGSRKGSRQKSSSRKQGTGLNSSKNPGARLGAVRRRSNAEAGSHRRKAKRLNTLLGDINAFGSLVTPMQQFSTTTTSRMQKEAQMLEKRLRRSGKPTPANKNNLGKGLNVEVQNSILTSNLGTGGSPEGILSKTPGGKGGLGFQKSRGGGLGLAFGKENRPVFSRAKELQGAFLASMNRKKRDNSSSAGEKGFIQISEKVRLRDKMTAKMIKRSVSDAGEIGVKLTKTDRSNEGSRTKNMPKKRHTKKKPESGRFGQIEGSLEASYKSKHRNAKKNKRKVKFESLGVGLGQELVKAQLSARTHYGPNSGRLGHQMHHNGSSSSINNYGSHFFNKIKSNNLENYYQGKPAKKGSKSKNKQNQQFESPHSKQGVRFSQKKTKKGIRGFSSGKKFSRVISAKLYSSPPKSSQRELFQMRLYPSTSRSRKNSGSKKRQLELSSKARKQAPGPSGAQTTRNATVNESEELYFKKNKAHLKYGYLRKMSQVFKTSYTESRAGSGGGAGGKKRKKKGNVFSMRINNLHKKLIDKGA